MTNRAEIILTGTDVSHVNRPVEIHDRRERDITIMFVANPCSVALSHSHGFDKVYSECTEDIVSLAVEDAKSGTSSIITAEVIDFLKMEPAYKAKIRTGRGFVKMFPPTDAPGFIKFWIGDDVVMHNFVLEPSFPKDEGSVKELCIEETPGHLRRQVVALTDYTDSLNENLAHPIRRMVSGQALATRELSSMEATEWLFCHGWISPSVDGWIASSECRRLLMRKAILSCKIYRM